MPPPLREQASRVFSFFGGGGDSVSNRGGSVAVPPSLKLHTDRDVYRPGDPVLITIEIPNTSPSSVSSLSQSNNAITSHNNNSNTDYSLLIEKLTFEMKGIEKLDTQWFTTLKPLSDSNQRRDFLQQVRKSSVPLLADIRLIRFPEHHFLQLVVNMFLWTAQWHIQFPIKLFPLGPLKHFNFCRNPEFHCKYGSLRKPIFQLKVGATELFLLQLSFWMSTGKRWMETLIGLELMNHTMELRKAVIAQEMKSRLCLPTTLPRKIYTEPSEVRYPCSHLLEDLQIKMLLSKNTLAYIHTYHFLRCLWLLRSYMILMFRHPGSLQPCSPSHQLKHSKFLSTEDDLRVPTAPGTVEPVASESFVRGRSYNIRLDDEVLLRFSPKNSDSSYYFSDMIGGALTFFHEEGFRRCLELSITLEMSETISRRFVHPSWRHSPTITKVHSDHHEVIAALVQTSFLFSIPMDGPMLFSTPHISVQWALRFEFFTTPKNVDWTRSVDESLIQSCEIALSEDILLVACYNRKCKLLNC